MPRASSSRYSPCPSFCPSGSAASSGSARGGSGPGTLTSTRAVASWTGIPSTSTVSASLPCLLGGESSIPCLCDGRGPREESPRWKCHQTAISPRPFNQKQHLPTGGLGGIYGREPCSRLRPVDLESGPDDTPRRCVGLYYLPGQYHYLSPFGHVLLERPYRTTLRVVNDLAFNTYMLHPTTR